ncbi:hypothetical protein [Micromonospora sp. CPCC 206061]|uniref:hypothetical protein n=1 Tax=Micromonospora sp. CPCC 206061 TaxID=3122410 RepID=UPI002FEEA868
MSESTGANAGFLTQVRQEIAEMEQIEAALHREHGLGTTSAQVRDEFAVLLRERTRELTELVDAGAADWARLDQLRAGRLAAVKAAALGVLEGILLRAHPLYADVTVAAERVLDDLVDRTGIRRDVLLSVAGAERFERTVGIIRMRFPDVTVWGLPILAHELGHMVAGTLPAPGQSSARPVEEYVSTEAELEAAITGADPTQARHRLHELFADVYATYALGPAYPLAVLTLRARPDRFEDATATHPSWTRRMWTMVEAIRELSVLVASPLVGQAYRRDANVLVLPRWFAVHGERLLDERAQRLVRRQAKALVALLDRNAPPRLRYDGAFDADGLGQRLAAGGDESAAPGAVLNAAWRWRTANPQADPETTRRFSAVAVTSLRTVTA